MLISGDLGGILGATVPMLPIMAPLSVNPTETTLSGCKCNEVSGLSGDCACKEIPPGVVFALGIPMTLATAFATYHVYQVMGQTAKTGPKIGLGIGVFVLALSTLCGAFRIVDAARGTSKPS